MIPADFNYVKPKSLKEFFEEIEQKDAKILAGGTDILVAMREDKLRPSVLIDIKALPELKGICEKKDGIFIGASETVQAVAEHPLLAGYTALIKGAGALACYELRLRATVGGNIANGSPSADCVPGLLLYNAAAVIASSNGESTMPLSEFLLAPGKVALKENEILVGVLLPKIEPSSQSRYFRATRVKGMDLSGMSAAVYYGGDNDVRIALGAIFPTVARAKTAEDIIKAEGLNQDVLLKALSELQKEISPRKTSMRATPEYKKSMVNELVVKALNEITGGDYHA